MYADSPKRGIFHTECSKMCLKQKMLTHIWSSYTIPSIPAKLQNADLILEDFKYICGLAKVHLQPCQTHVWLTKEVMINYLSTVLNDPYLKILDHQFLQTSSQDLYVVTMLYRASGSL